jgi:hypothetical protein
MEYAMIVMQNRLIWPMVVSANAIRKLRSGAKNLMKYLSEQVMN